MSKQILFRAGDVVEFHNPPGSPHPMHPREHAPGPYVVDKVSHAARGGSHPQLVWITLRKGDDPVYFSGFWFRYAQP